VSQKSWWMLVELTWTDPVTPPNSIRPQCW